MHDENRLWILTQKWLTGEITDEEDEEYHRLNRQMNAFIPQRRVSLWEIIKRWASRMRSRHYERNGLTDRQKQVISGIARGLTNAQIARELNTSTSTIETHINSICARLKLGIDVTREELPQRAKAQGIEFEEKEVKNNER